MITHDGIGQQIDGEDPRQLRQPSFHPRFSMIEVLAAIAILATQESASHTACRAVVVRCVVKADLLTPWYRHVEFLPGDRLTSQLSKTAKTN